MRRQSVNLRLIIAWNNTEATSIDGPEGIMSKTYYAH